MSGNLAGQSRALPFTGFGTLPLIVIGIVLSGLGWLMALIGPKHKSS